MRLKLKALTFALIAAVIAALAPAAGASTSQVAMFQSDSALYGNPIATLNTLRSLGATEVRVSAPWFDIYVNGPRAVTEPHGFNGADPRSPEYDFTALDQIVRDAPRYGITVDLSLTGGAPVWATGGGQPAGGPFPEWRPSAREYGKFVQAVGTRYDGRFRPTAGAAALPRVRVWEIWNEPNFGPDLAPQSINKSSVSTSPGIYRGLVDAAWSALGHSGHGHDTVILGNLDARGLRGRPTKHNPDGYPGTFAPTKPIAFIRSLYCLDGGLHPIRGKTAKAMGCPTTAAGSRRFRRDHPGLFQAAGFADHPYQDTTAPNRTDSSDRDFAELIQIPHMAHVLDEAQHAYGSGHRFGIYNNEFGYITNPPTHSQPFPSPALAATWINFAEYISYNDPRLVSTMQFLLEDPIPTQTLEFGGFASGLIFSGGKLKPSYDAYRLPVYMPATSVRRNHSTLVWGCARPAAAYRQRRVLVQYQAGRHGAFATIATLSVHNARGYFETHVRLRSSGALRLAWSYPAGPTVYSRSINVTVR
jgi:hypothetical protein